MNTCPVEMRGVTPIPDTGAMRDNRLPDQRQILAMARVKLPRSGREAAVEVRPLPAETRPMWDSEAQGLSGEAMKGNPTTTVILRVDESKIAPEELSEPNQTVDLAGRFSLSFVFHARAHDAISATHPTTLEITKDRAVTRRGDCIVASNSSKGLCDIPSSFKKELSTEDGRARLTLRVGTLSFSLVGRGARGLTFSHPSEIVVRKSGFVSDRTLMVHADRAAEDIPRQMVSLLREPKNKVTIEICILANAGPH